MSHIISGLTIALLTILLIGQAFTARGESKIYSGGECYQMKKPAKASLKEFVKL